MRLWTAALWALVLCAPAAARSHHWHSHPVHRSAVNGLASYYGNESGRTTASGQRFAPGGLTAAHRSLPFGSRVLVSCASTGRSVVVVINDRGPAAWTGRVIDLAQGAAHRLGITRLGTARVHLEVVR